MAVHFLPYSRIRLADLTSVPAHLYLLPGVLMCGKNDLLRVEGYGLFRVLGVAWTGENGDEADVTVELVEGL